MRKLLFVPIFPVVGLLLTGCPHKGVADPDAQSGADGNRSGARSIHANTTITDDVSYRGLDRTDWYTLRLDGKPGMFTIDINWDNDSADLIVGVFDESGTQLTATPTRRRTIDKAKRLLTQIEKPGTYYVRVQAAGEDDATAYTMRPQWEEPKAPAPAPPPPPPPPKEEHKPKTAKPEPTPAPAPPPEEKPTDGLQARIIRAFKYESGQLTLEIDKGTAAGVKVGTTGSVLEGRSGEVTVSGGDFKVVSVDGANKCTAHTSIKSIGKNSRVLLQISQ